MARSSKSTFPTAAPSGERAGTILLIDDDEDVRTALAANLRDDGYTVREFTSPPSSPESLNLGDVDVVISDYRTGGTDGLLLADGLHRTHPRLPVVLITAYWSHHLENEAARRGNVHLWRKPFDYEELYAWLAGMQPPARAEC